MATVVANNRYRVLPASHVGVEVFDLATRRAVQRYVEPADAGSRRSARTTVRPLAPVPTASQTAEPAETPTNALDWDRTLAIIAKIVAIASGLATLLALL